MGAPVKGDLLGGRNGCLGPTPAADAGSGEEGTLGTGVLAAAAASLVLGVCAGGGSGQESTCEVESLMVCSGFTRCCWEVQGLLSTSEGSGQSRTWEVEWGVALEGY